MRGKGNLPDRKRHEEKPDRKRRVHQEGHPPARDIRTDIQELAEQALKELNETVARVKRTPMPKLSQEQQEIVNKITKKGERPEYQLNILSSIRDADIVDYPEKYWRENPAFYQAAMQAGYKLIRQGRMWEAGDMFGQLVRENIGPIQHRQVPPEIGARALYFTNKISRAHVLAQALQYLGLPTKGFGAFRKKNHEDIVWTSQSVKDLSVAGEPRDLLPISVVGRHCGEGALESYCSYAQRRILTRDGLMRVLHGGARSRLSRFGINTKGMSDRMLAERFAPLIEELGLGYVIQRTGGASGIRAQSYNPVDDISENWALERMQEKGLDQRLQYHGRFFEQQDSWMVSASRDFLMKHGALRKDGGLYRLTQKGQELVKFLLTFGVGMGEWEGPQALHG